MNASQSALRRAALRSRASNTIVNSTRQWARYNSNAPQAPRRKGGKFVGFAAIFGAAAAGAYYYPTLKDLFITPDAEEEAPKKAQLEFEKPLKPVETKEEYRDLISSQHLQLKHSWEHPGVYAWGSNVGKVIDPDSKDKYIKLPRRIAYFNNQLLRDLKLSQMFGAAVTEKGDLVQWGLGFSQAHPAPVPTLKGKDIVKIDVSLDRIIALSRNGSVYSIPASRDDQEGGLKEEQTKSSWSFWRAVGKEDIHFRNLTPSGLGRGESVVDISSGQEHCLLLTNKGRVFSAASSALEFPSKGQMGVPGLSWENRPKGPYDQPHEIVGLKGFEASQIATGDFHSVVLDKTGKIFTFGCNSFGQLGFDTDYGLVFLDTPTMLPTNRLYPSGGPIPTVTSIAAGGLNTFFSIDAKAPVVHKNLAALAPAKKFPPITSDLWACGQGVYGTLGNGRWSHVSAKPTKVKSLSSLFEFNEKTNMMMPIKIKSLSIGTTHCAAIMDNVTETSINGSASKDDTNWGADALFWGGNEHYQLGTAKRTNMNTPTYIGALDGEPKSDFHRLCVAPRKTVRLGEGGKGRKATLEQKIECGKFVTGVYSAV